jgi:gas vesicle protein
MGRIADVRGKHPLATGMVAGTAVGACVALLFAPRRGSETRKQARDGVNRVVSSTSNGYRRAKGTVGNWANRSQKAYVATRDRVVKGAKGTSQYVREVTDAVTMKAHRESNTLKPAHATALSGQPRKAI